MSWNGGDGTVRRKSDGGDELNELKCHSVLLVVACCVLRSLFTPPHDMGDGEWRWCASSKNNKPADLSVLYSTLQCPVSANEKSAKGLENLLRSVNQSTNRSTTATATATTTAKRRFWVLFL